jgi:glyoxylase-like metal-dependent hydrolase (beta-lactamase superfamily II)
MATQVTSTVAGGDRFGSLLAIDTPGHTPDHIAFLDERDGTLFAGDALITMGRVAVTSDSPWYFPQKKFVWSAPVAIDSVRHLLDYPVARVACGHGKVREGGHLELRAALKTAEALQR